MDFHVVVLLLFLVLLSVPQLLSLALLVQRREVQPIKYRGVSLLFVSGCAIYLAWVWHMLFLMYEVSESGTRRDADAAPEGLRQYFCGEWQWILWICNALIMGGYFLRSFRIIKIFHDHTSWVSPLSLQQQLNGEGNMSNVAAASSSMNAGGSSIIGLSLGNPVLSNSQANLLSLSGSTRKLDNRIYTERYMLKLLFALLVVVSVIKVILDRTPYPVVYSGFGCHTAQVWGWLVVDLLEIAFLLAAIWKLRTIRDDYGICSELITVCVIWIVCSVGLGVSIFLRKGSSVHWFGGSQLGLEAYLEFQASVWSVRNIAIFFTSISWPLIQSYYNSFPPLWSNCDALCSLETLLKDIVCIQYFRNYLMSVNRVEWILCWVEMELFKDLDGDEEADAELIAAQSRRIYEKYIQLGSELEVHLSPSIVHVVTRDVHVGVPSLSCFEEAQRELMQLMENEFPRFLSSPSCESCLHELEREEVLREVLEKSGMI